MIQGKLALGGLSLEFGGAQKRFDELSAKVEELADRQGHLLEEERQVIEELARIYLPELTPEAVSEGLRELQAHLRDALAEQRQHHVAIAQTREEAERRVDELQADVDTRAQTEADAATRLDQVRAAVEATLGEDSEPQQMADEHGAIMARRAALKHRRARLQGTANVERHKYEAFKPFAYLQKRQYGEPEYHAGFIARALDRWLAHRTAYDVLAERYRILRIGPHAIQAEIRRLSDRAAELEAELDRRQDEAGARHGLIPALQADAEAQRVVVEARQRLHEATERRDALAAELRAVEAHRGGPYEDAVAMHEDFLQSQSVRELERLARTTPDPRDDALVARLDELRARLEGSDKDLAVHRTELERLANRTGSLADLAREAARSFSSRRSYFPEAAKLKDMVGLLLDKQASTEELMDELWQQHTPRQIIVPTDARGLEGWFAELSSVFDPELGAVTVHVDDALDVEHEIIVHDADGRVLHRRVTRRMGPDGGSDV